MRLQWCLKHTVLSSDSSWTLIVSLHGCDYQYFNHILYRFYCRPWYRACVSSHVIVLRRPCVWKPLAEGLSSASGGLVAGLSCSHGSDTNDWLPHTEPWHTNEDRRRRAMSWSDGDGPQCDLPAQNTKKSKKKVREENKRARKRAKLTQRSQMRKKARNVGDSVRTVDAHKWQWQRKEIVVTLQVMHQ